MEDYIQDIELINQFIDNELTGDEKNNVLNRIEIDEVFKALYEEHIILLEGIKRVEIKHEINAIHNNYLKAKWFKYITISLFTIAVIIASYLLLTGEDETIVKKDLHKEFNTEQVVITEDTTSIEIEEIDTLNKVSLTKKVKSTSPNILVDTTNQIEYNIKNALKKKAQDFTINVERDTVLIGNEGTRLIIKANSFINKDAVSVNGKINVKLTEYYELSDILFEDLSTTSDDKLLETGGMLFIEARKENKVLKLKDNVSMQIEFPFDKEKKDMQLFLGEEAEYFINWELSNQVEDIVVKPIIVELKPDPIRVDLEKVDLRPESIRVKPDSIRNSPNEIFVSLVEKSPVYPGCKKNTNNNSRKCTKDRIREFIAANFNTDIIEELNLSRQRVNVKLRINKEGTVTKVYVPNIESKLEAEIRRVLTRLPQMIPAEQFGEPVEVEYRLVPLILGKEDNTIDRVPFVRDSVSVNRSEVVVRDDTTGVPKLGSVRVNEFEKVNRYTLRAPKLGWINCDRFVRSNKKKIKYKFKIKDAKGVDVKLIFKDISSVLPYKRQGEFYDFGTVPKDDAIKLIAIKIIGGKLYIDIIDTVIKASPNIEFNFEEVTIEQLQKRIEELNNEF